MIKVVIMGRPNVGKSTIFNILAGTRKAIVYDTPGVTRDRIYAEAMLGKYTYSLVDTPGIDKVVHKGMHDQVEYQAIVACGEADIVIMVLEEGYCLGGDIEIANYVKRHCSRVILLRNKSDQRRPDENYYKLGFGAGLKFSAEHRTGLKDLKIWLAEQFLQLESLKLLPKDTTLEDNLEHYNNNIVSLQYISDKLESKNIVLTTAEKKALARTIEPDTSQIHDSSVEDHKVKTFEALLTKITSLHDGSLSADLAVVPRVCIVGRPNSGKSTYINTITSTNRMIVHQDAGTTRDSIEMHWQWDDRKLILIDTAGMRKKSKVSDDIENFSVYSGVRSIKLSDVVIVMIDAQNMIQHQDLEIMEIAARSGKGLIIAINKCDLMPRQKDAKHSTLIDTNIFQVSKVPVVYCSNFKNFNTDKIITEALKVFDRMMVKISTSKLNTWLKEAVNNHMPPVIPKTQIRIKLKYITQVSNLPKVFRIFCNANDEQIADSYKKYLINSLAENFAMFGVPIKLKFIKNHNPYV